MIDNEAFAEMIRLSKLVSTQCDAGSADVGEISRMMVEFLRACPPVSSHSTEYPWLMALLAQSEAILDHNVFDFPHRLEIRHLFEELLGYP